MGVIGYNQSKINKEFTKWLKKRIKDEGFCLWLEKLIADERFLKIRKEVEAIDAEYEAPKLPEGPPICSFKEKPQLFPNEKLKIIVQNYCEEIGRNRKVLHPHGMDDERE